MNLGTIFLSSFFSTASAGLCEDQGKELEVSGRSILGCKEVDFGVRAISADYQKRQTEPVSIYPARVRARGPGGSGISFSYVNEIPGIRNSLKYNPITSPKVDPTTLSSRGHSLLYKFNLALIRDPNLSRDSEILEWLRDPGYGLLFELIPNSGSLSWEGRCDLWAAWSIDPEVRRALDRHRQAMVCHEVPFTRGELKELITVLYSRSEIEMRLNLKGFVSGASGVRGPSLEDANLALIKLGAFGEGSEFSPERLFDLAKQAFSQGRNLIFEMDPGEEVWNQPIEAIADITFSDDSVKDRVFPGMKHFSSTERDTVGLRERLVSLETALLSKARIGQQETVSELCAAAATLSQPCPSGTVWLSDQVDLLHQYQRLGVDRGILKYSGAGVEHHALVIQYGVEGSFAVSDDEPSRVKLMEYTRIGNDAFWSPRSARLSDWCGFDSNAPDLRREERNSLIFGQNRSEVCSRFKADPTKDRNLILGALPPEKIEYFRARRLSSDSVRSRAYRSLIELTERCQGVDSAAQFLRDFEATLSRGAVSGSRVDFLRNRYQEEKSSLEPGYVERRVREKLSSGYYPGFDELLRVVRE